MVRLETLFSMRRDCGEGENGREVTYGSFFLGKSLSQCHDLFLLGRVLLGRGGCQTCYSPIELVTSSEITAGDLANAMPHTFVLLNCL